MLIAKKTLYRRSSGDYGLPYGGRTRKRKWDWFVCGDSLWEVFPLSGPAPEAIRIELHDTPSKDRVEIVNSPLEDEAYFDGVEHRLCVAGFDWLSPCLKKYGTVYTEVWY